VVLRPSGHIEIAGDSGLFRADTLQCVHCGCHWQVRRGSKITRGFCFNCNGPICSKKCAVCVPAEQKLENIEHGRRLDFKPIRVPVIKI